MGHPKVVLEQGGKENPFPGNFLQTPSYHEIKANSFFFKFPLKLGLSLLFYLAVYSQAW